MSDVNDKLERQIVRSLDGMLDEQQQLELDRELIRNPAARRLMDEYCSTDQLAVAALAGIAAQSADVDRIVAIATQETTKTLAESRRSNRTWMLIPGAIAAAVLAMVIPRPSFESTTIERPPMVSNAPDLQSPAHFGNQLSPTQMNQHNVPLQTVGHKPSIRRRTGTEWIGVIGEDGNVYWIEVQRSRTIRTPLDQRRTGETSLEM